MKKLILLSGSPCVGKTTVGKYLFEHYDNSAYLDGDWCWCVNPFSVKDKRLRNGDKSMSFVLSNYLTSGFDYVFFASVVLTDNKIRENILKDITASSRKSQESNPRLNLSKKKMRPNQIKELARWKGENSEANA